MELNERVKACRLQAGLTQEQVAEALQVSRQAVTKWENGRSAPSTEKLFKLAELFGTTVDLLITDGTGHQCPIRVESQDYKFWEDINFWISFFAGLVVFLVICPYGHNMYIPIAFTLLCIGLNAYSVITFSVLLYKLLAKKNIGDDCGMYTGLLILGSIGHAIFAMMNWGSWVCLALSLISFIWLAVKKWSENQKNSEKST